jgi:hypothetical protein
MQLTVPVQIRTVAAVFKLFDTSEIYLARMLFYDLGSSHSHVTHPSKANHNSVLNVDLDHLGSLSSAI